MLNLNHLKNHRFLSSRLNPVRHNSAISRLLILITLLSFNYGCGKRRPPLPPAASPAINQTGFTISQQGNKIALSIPLRNHNNAAPPRQIDIYRLAESTGSPLFLTEDEFASRSTQVGSIQIPPGQTKKEAVFFDAITPIIQTRRLRYAVRFVNRENQKSPFSNFIFFEPIGNAAKPPILGQPVPTQTTINLSWQMPTENIDGTQPANVLGFNVYRKSKQTEEPQRLNPSLLSESSFEDKNFRFGEDYEYFVRTVSTGANGIQIESSDSNAIEITPRDIFPPAAPEGLTIAAAPGNLSVFYAANAEPDVIGYNIFRTTTPGLARERWQKLNADALTATAYQDVKVETGQKYYYYVTAIDSAGNNSQPSEIVSETAP